MSDLRRLLKEKFGFQDFRPSQEQVCLAVESGEDVLLVMPTGAGKSLCYQLPGLARGGTTLVISPLLALIDDQVAKLRRLGFRAEQIHSGRTREDSRRVCIQYLLGELDFLFIAPERLAVRGFPEMLQKWKPSLIAIDEAHCISQWGHDFRPEYRKLGERLAGLRPVPIIALTATATPLVQDDIVKQLGIPGAKKFIQGFRRTNIAIRVHEVPPASRARACITLLAGDASSNLSGDNPKTPAIVYAPTRRAAEEIAKELKSLFHAECYHAGMPSDAREDVQSRFLAGKFDVIVATVAFGMGIDKSDVRTVIHAGLTGSVEGYYQEIGRAGRDGKPSSAVLLHSFADQRTHDFFFERDYPEFKFLELIYRQASAQAQPKDWIRENTVFNSKPLDFDVFEKALEKLWIHGGVLVDPEENVMIGHPGWSKTYEKQRNHRKQSLQQMATFAQTGECRMLFFLRHFGDHDDLNGPCGTCDRCVVEVSDSRLLSREEREIAAQIMAALSGLGAVSVGKLFEELATSNRKLARRSFEQILEMLAASKWISIRQESFSKGTETIHYRKVEQESLGEYAKASDLEELRIVATPWSTPSNTSGTADGTLEAKPRKRTAKPRTLKRKTQDQISSSDLSTVGPPTALIDKLKSWRLAKAREQGLPAFRIFGDRVLNALAEHRPGTLDELLEVRGFGPKLKEKYGSEILKCLTDRRNS